MPSYCRRCPALPRGPRSAWSRKSSFEYAIGEVKLLVSKSAPALIVCLPMIFENEPPNCQSSANPEPCNCEPLRPM